MDLWSRRPKLSTDQVGSLGLLSPCNDDRLKNRKKNRVLRDMVPFLISYHIYTTTLSLSLFFLMTGVKKFWLSLLLFDWLTTLQNGSSTFDRTGNHQMTVDYTAHSVFDPIMYGRKQSNSTPSLVHGSRWLWHVHMYVSDHPLKLLSVYSTLIEFTFGTISFVFLWLTSLLWHS